MQERAIVGDSFKDGERAILPDSFMVGERAMNCDFDK